MRVDMHQPPVNYKTAARSFCKQTRFSRFYFWDRKLSCKVASLQWASLVVPRVLLGCHDIWWSVSSSLYTAFRFSSWHQRLCPVWGVLTLYTTLERLGVTLRCCTKVFIFDVPGLPLDVH